MTSRILILGFCGCLSASILSRADAPIPEKATGTATAQKALSPEESLKAIQVPDGFKVELAASEPLVADPIAVEWGEDGRLWVVEMGDYPLGMDGKGQAGGSIRVLEDTNGDGVYDKQSTFLDGLAFPQGVLPWRKGVIVAAGPEILFAEDRDGDGKADHREVLFKGFSEGNPQHRINGFALGLDGWVYGANGYSHGEVLSPKTGKTVQIQGRDFRFKPDTGEFETESGQSQYGRQRDDWGNWFGNSNSDWGWHYVLTEADVARNPYYAPPDPRHALEPDTRLYPISRLAVRFNDPQAANHATSANSPAFYRDVLFGPDFTTSLFLSEPVHNLVHRLVLSPDGPTYSGHRAMTEQKSEFLASTDQWFRPTQIKTGPDGALWIVDMYRDVIEHPEWIPDEIQKRIDLRAGEREGRIYRVSRTDQPPRRIERLDQLGVEQLVQSLESPNGWRRDTAQRLLMHRDDRSCLPLLHQLVQTTAEPRARVHALWLLSILGGLDEADVLKGLGDPEPQVRRNALKLSEPLLDKSQRVEEAVKGFARETDPCVRLQFAVTLGNCKKEWAGVSLAQLLVDDSGDSWIRAAALTSVVPHITTVLDELIATKRVPSSEVIQSLATISGLTLEPSSVKRAVEAISRPSAADGNYASWQFAAVTAFLDASERSKNPLSIVADPALQPILDAARKIVTNEKETEANKIQAVQLLRFSATTVEEDRQLLVSLLTPRDSIDVQRASIVALGMSATTRCPDLILKNWKSYSPPLRSSVVDLLLNRKPWTSCLLESIENQLISPGEISASQRGQLLSHRDLNTRNLAQKLFSHQAESRQKVLESYQPALSMSGDAEAGKAVFSRVCAVCHKVGDVGVEVGPNLGMMKEKSPEAIMMAILDPNRAFESRYASFTIATRDGLVHDGLIASETASAVTLRGQEGKEATILRRDIEEMTSSGQSLMPEGLEKDLSQHDLANLIRFLEGVEPPPKSFAGNQPAVVKPSDDGIVRLEATTAEIRGDRLAFEEKNQNLGFWSAENDHATWRFILDRPGEYAVWIDWACADDSAGETVELNVGEQKLQQKIAGTGTWDDFNLRHVGALVLPEGESRLIVRSVGPPRNALFDLRRVELRPRGGL